MDDRSLDPAVPFFGSVCRRARRRLRELGFSSLLACLFFGGGTAATSLLGVLFAPTPDSRSTSLDYLLAGLAMLGVWFVALVVTKGRLLDIIFPRPCKPIATPSDEKR